LGPSLLLLSDLYKKGVTLPCPKTMLGNLDKEQMEDFEEDDDAPGQNICLRQTDEHATFLYLFLKAVVSGEVFNKCSCNQLLSGYMSVNLEAYAVLTYVNRSVPCVLQGWVFVLLILGAQSFLYACSSLFI
jgi:hypothetical protein